DFLSALRHSLIKPFRSSPLSALALASALHFFILSCWVIGAAGAPAFRQVDMKAFRSSPFLSPASALQDFIFSCWGVSFLSSAAGLAEYAPMRRETVARATRNGRIVAS